MTLDEYQACLLRMRERLHIWNERCASLAPQVREVQPAPGVWSIKQNTFHVGDAFEATAIRMRAMLTEDEPQLLRFDADEWAAERDYQGRPWLTAITRLNEQFDRLLAVVEGLDAGQLERTGRQYNIAVNILGLPTEVLRVADLLLFEAAHIDEHLASIDEIIAQQTIAQQTMVPV